MSVNNVLARNLLRAREKSNLTQKEVSKKTGITEVSISRYENGERIPNAVILYKLAQCYGVSIDRVIFNPSKEDYLEELGKEDTDGF